jgi:protein-S-isoprenylcysteine O-methyltransferase Ste14
MIHPSLFLRRALQADAIFSGVAALMFVFGASLFASLTNLPEVFLRNTGFVLVVYAALVGYLGTRTMMAKAAVWTVIAVNAIWAVDSIALLASGLLSPNLFGQALIVMQAVAVGVFAELQFIGLRRSAAGDVVAH